ncbi:hypothetical protein C1H76_2609 [Elsinoe australis]|uniref:Uncharacterized protein n=1 Tax=Elsinoe australis TaxID=40998 RepID=A0A4U7BB83_9PEZI|nr:hypothetical protein C1H76_2609 [Elsinoe australis]
METPNIDTGDVGPSGGSLTNTISPPFVKEEIYPYFFAAIALLKDIVASDQKPGFQASEALKDQLHYLTTSAHAMKESVDDQALNLFQKVTELAIDMSPGSNMSTLFTSESEIRRLNRANQEAKRRGADEFEAREIAAMNPQTEAQYAECLAKATEEREKEANYQRFIRERAARAPLPPSNPRNRPSRFNIPPPPIPPPNTLMGIIPDMQDLNIRGTTKPAADSSAEEEYYSSTTGGNGTSSEDVEMADSSDYAPEEIVNRTSPVLPGRATATYNEAFGHFGTGALAGETGMGRAPPPYTLARWESMPVYDERERKWLARPLPARREPFPSSYGY